MSSGDEARCKRRKRRRSTQVSSIIFILSLAACSSSWQAVDAFGIRKWVSRRGRIISRGTEEVSGRLLADKNDDEGNGSWSKSVNGSRSSPLQVRRRVRAVLEKARTRTGVENSSTSKPSSILAEAASIGGLDDEYVIKVKDSETSNGSSQPEVNGKANGSSAAPTTKVFADEQFIVQKVSSTNSTTELRKSSDFDVIRGDVPAANAFVEPLPFELPKLSQEQIQLLEAGERLQEQSRMGREGSGYVVLDVKAPSYVVWERLLDFESYPETIPTVKKMQLYTSEKLNIGYVNEKPVSPGTGRETRHYGIPSITRASFILSKFQLNIAAVHKYTPHPTGDYMIFTLDKSCTNMVLKGAKGIWHTVENPGGREGWTRVYLLCEVRISRALPSFIVDYAADRAMPRATTWLKPQVEADVEEWSQL